MPKVLIENTIKVKRRGKKQRGYNYQFQCSDCKKTIDCPKTLLSQHSGKCRSCLQSRKPYEHLYTILKGCSLRRNRELNLSYEEFIEFVKIETCHYCDSKIFWNMHARRKGPQTKCYNLDRKDTLAPYSPENCVVCCYDCNWMKGCNYTYEEFMLLSPGLKQIKRNRK